MKNTINKIVIIFTFIFLATNYNIHAQEIKFPESFRGDTSLFKGMKFAAIPQEVKTKYGISENPGLIDNPYKAKGLLMSGSIPSAKAVYFEIYEDIEEQKMDCGFEVVQFTSEDELKKTLPLLDKKKRDATFLTLENYLIFVYCDGYKNFEERIDKMSTYFQEKLGARLYQDRRKDKREDDAPSDTSSKMPPPLPPGPENTSTKIDLNELEPGIEKENGFAYLRSKERQKIAPGNYSASAFYPAYETLTFTINRDSLLNGGYEYYYAEDFREAPTKQTIMQFDNGIKVSEMIYLNGKLKVAITNASTIAKQGSDYLITLSTATKNAEKGDKEVVTVFRNRKPISKTTTRDHISIIKKDFEKGILQQYDHLGRLRKLQKPGFAEEYNSAGEVTYKMEWIDGNQFIYKNGKLRHKEVRVKDKDQFLVTEYDADGKIISEEKEDFRNFAIVADPDEYENEMTREMFEYYKKKLK